MGPRRFSRGNLPPPRRPSLGGRCFNGAAAFQPRKLHPRHSKKDGRLWLQWGRGVSAAEMKAPHRARPPIRGFNGAAAFQPRKSTHTELHKPVHIASMGPRRFSRGNNAASRSSGVVSPASMGPRRFSRGNSHMPLIRTQFKYEASMGPRRFSRGNNRKTGQIRPFPDASMGPRRFSRGNYVSRYQRVSRCSGFNGAAAFQPRKFLPFDEKRTQLA